MTISPSRPNCEVCGSDTHLTEQHNFEIRSGMIIPTKNELSLTKQDAMVLYQLLEHQYIHYDNLEAHALLNRISKFVHS